MTDSTFATIEMFLGTFDPAIYLFGFADLKGLLPKPYQSYVSGIAIARRFDPSTIDGISGGPTKAYLAHHHEVNAELNTVVPQLVAALHSSGVEALGVTEQADELERSQRYQETLSCPISHKLVATRAGVGWIGKTDLLVTKEAGPRVRLASILLTATLPSYGNPVTRSSCGICRVCVDGCPAQAATGSDWSPEIHRDVYFDAHACRAYCQKQNAIFAKQGERKAAGICGRCISLCSRGRK